MTERKPNMWEKLKSGVSNGINHLRTSLANFANRVDEEVVNAEVGIKTFSSGVKNAGEVVKNIIAEDYHSVEGSVFQKLGAVVRGAWDRAKAVTKIISDEVKIRENLIVQMLRSEGIEPTSWQVKLETARQAAEVLPILIHEGLGEFEATKAGNGTIEQMKDRSIATGNIERLSVIERVCRLINDRKQAHSELADWHCQNAEMLIQRRKILRIARQASRSNTPVATVA